MGSAGEGGSGRDRCCGGGVDGGRRCRGAGERELGVLMGRGRVSEGSGCG